MAQARGYHGRFASTGGRVLASSSGGTHLRAAQRKGLKKSQFGLPRKRKYPVDTLKRAYNAKSRATQMAKRGKLSAAGKRQVHARANRAIKRMKGRR